MPTKATFDRFALALTLWLMPGCIGKIAERLDADFRDPALVAATSQPTTQPTTARTSIVPIDPPIFFRPQVNLSIYHLTVPVGSVSRSQEFWKRVDEQAVDAATYDVLYKNGIRIGRAKLADLDAFMSTLDRNPIKTQPTVFVSAGAEGAQLPMKEAVQDQTIYDFDSKNVMTVRTFEDCDNLFCVDFQPAPRKPGDVRVTICPMVRTLRKRLVTVSDAETREVVYRNPEKYYRLSLRTDIPLDAFLIIAPSPEAQWKMSLGSAFLTRDGTAEKLEDVLLVIPRAMGRRVEKPTTQASTRSQP